MSTRRTGNIIPALAPAGDPGVQFVLYGDCCSGKPGTRRARNFARVNTVLRRLQPPPEFVCFAGDHVAGLTPDEAELRRQWRHWLSRETGWAARARIPLYHVTSNHNTYSPMSEAVWRDVFRDIPRNGPEMEQGLAYVVRRGPLLLVVTNSASSRRGYGRVEHEWLDRVLAEHHDAPFKFVAGHYPVHPVNGYGQFPLWRIDPVDGKPFWDTLVRHHVAAYLCSHVIAFDAQVHQGVLQITSGGAGTEWGPGGFMPGPAEYHHLVQLAVDRDGLRYQVLDSGGRVRETLAWPPPVPRPRGRQTVPLKTASLPAAAGGDPSPLILRLRGRLPRRDPGCEQTLLCAWNPLEGPPVLWLGLSGSPPALVLRVAPEAGRGPVEWSGLQAVPPAFDLTVMLHPGLGPGGVLARHTGQQAWSSLMSASAVGPGGWQRATHRVAGHGSCGPEDAPFRGRKLEVNWQLCKP